MNEVSKDFGQNVFNNMMKDWIEPEVKRRQLTGELPTIPFGLREAQIIFQPGKYAKIRLNEEVKYLKEGNNIKLIDEEISFGHMTLYLDNGKHNLSFDFRYNRNKSKDQLDLANEYISASEHSLEKGNINATIENLYSVYEQIATSLLVQSPDIVIGKSHGTIHSLINKYMLSRPNFDKRFIQYFNLLSSLRPKARYEKITIDHNYKEMIEVANISKEIINHNL